MANKLMERRITPLIITNMQIKITMRYHFTQVRMAIIKKSTKQSMMKSVWRKGDALVLLVGM